MAVDVVLDGRLSTGCLVVNIHSIDLTLLHKSHSDRENLFYDNEKIKLHDHYESYQTMK